MNTDVPRDRVTITENVLGILDCCTKIQKLVNGLGPPVNASIQWVSVGITLGRKKMIFFLYLKAYYRRQKVSLNSVRTSQLGSILCLLTMMAKFIISLLKGTL